MRATPAHPLMPRSPGSYAYDQRRCAQTATRKHMDPLSLGPWKEWDAEIRPTRSFHQARARTGGLLIGHAPARRNRRSIRCLPRPNQRTFTSADRARCRMLGLDLPSNWRKTHGRGFGSGAPRASIAPLERRVGKECCGPTARIDRGPLELIKVLAWFGSGANARACGAALAPWRRELIDLGFDAADEIDYIHRNEYERLRIEPTWEAVV